MSTPRHVQAIFAALVGAALVVTAASAVAQAGASRRQYYNDWNFYPQFGYYYISYYYQPSPRDNGYKYQFCLFYPSNPRFVYYFDPALHRYWGRLDMKGTPGHQFSLLAEKDRKEKLKDIPEDAFPKPGKMPPIPESKDGTAMEPIRFLPNLPAEPEKSTPQANK
jgi:hypothetical protein